MMGKKFERIEKIGIFEGVGGGVGEGGVSKRSKTHYLCVCFILFFSVLEKLRRFLKETR